MYFETAGIEINPFIPPLVAFLVSFFTSTGGVSGAFLLLPFQMSVLGYTAPSVSATNQLFNIVAIPSGVYKYIREKRMLWPLTIVIIAGTLPGVFAGAIIRVEYLPDPTNFKLFAGVVLLYIGLRLLFSLFSKIGGKSADKKPDTIGVVTKKFDLMSLVFSYSGDEFKVNNILLFILSLIVGIVGGIYGIGGGAIIAPFIVAIFRLPVHSIAGSTLMGTLITSVTGVIYYQILSIYYPAVSIAPDWWLGFLFGIGGFAGMYLGASVQKRMPAKAIKSILTFCITFIGIKYILEYFL